MTTGALLALDAIDGADPFRERWQCLHQGGNLGVVGSDDEDLSFRQQADRVLAGFASCSDWSGRRRVSR